MCSLFLCKRLCWDVIDAEPKGHTGPFRAERGFMVQEKLLAEDLKEYRNSNGFISLHNGLLIGRDYSCRKPQVNDSLWATSVQKSNCLFPKRQLIDVVRDCHYSWLGHRDTDIFLKTGE